MSKLLALFALTTALTVGACKDKSAKVDPAATPTESAKPTEPKPGEVAPNPTTQPDDPKPGDPRPASINGELPQECKDYQAAIDSLATCDKLPQPTRDTLKQAYEQQSAAWANLTAEAKEALGPACKSAADAVKQSATVCN